MSDFLFDLAWRSLACAAMVLLALRWLRSRSAAVLSAVSHAGIVVTLVLPVSAHVLRPMTSGWLDVPASALPHGLTPELQEASTLPSTPGAIVTSVPEEQPPVPWATGVYLVVMGFLLGHLLMSLARLAKARRKATPVVDRVWTSHLDRVLAEHGTARRVDLLLSTEAATPASWGLFRPVVVIDPRTAQDHSQIDVVLRHELAHVRHHDWAKLMLAKVATALFWFNPMVWVLARRCHELRERCADDAVLSRTNVSPSAYARLLVDASLRTGCNAPAMNHAMARRTSELARRVDGILDEARARTPVSRSATLAACTTLMLATAPIAAVEVAPRQNAVSTLDARAGERAAAQLALSASSPARTLAHALATQDWEARRGVGVTLMYDASVVSPLLLALSDERPSVRRIALWGLSEVRPNAGPQAAASIAAMLDDRSPEIRGEAARALADHGQAQYTQPIAALLHDPESSVREQAIHALADLGDPQISQRVATLRADIDPAVRAKARWAVTQLDAVPN